MQQLLQAKDLTSLVRSRLNRRAKCAAERPAAKTGSPKCVDFRHNPIPSRELFLLHTSCEMCLAPESDCAASHAVVSHNAMIEHRCVRQRCIILLIS
jgi:hypothetical protein